MLRPKLVYYWPTSFGAISLLLFLLLWETLRLLYFHDTGGHAIRATIQQLISAFLEPILQTACLSQRSVKTLLTKPELMPLDLDVFAVQLIAIIQDHTLVVESFWMIWGSSFVSSLPQLNSTAHFFTIVLERESSHQVLVCIYPTPSQWQDVTQRQFFLSRV